MQAVGRHIETDIAGDPAGLGAHVERRLVGHLVDEAALGEDVEKFGTEGGHDGLIGNEVSQKSG
jgi:hypothetical protein